MTTAELEQELRSRLALEYVLYREADHCESEAVEKFIRENAARIDELQMQLSQSTAPAVAG